MLRQSQQQRLLQKLSPQQIQFLKLLRVPTIEMEMRIKEEMEINPALEYNEEVQTQEDDIYKTNENDEFESLDDASLKDDDAEKIDIDDYIRNEGDDSGYDYSGDNEKNSSFSIRYEAGFHQYLLDQLSMLYLDEQQIKVAEQIIGSINDDGYLAREVNAIVDDLAFGQNIIVSAEEVVDIIKQIQTFDPPGIAVYTLQECLILQLKRIDQFSVAVKNAIEILEKYYDSFVRKHYDKILRGMNIDDSQLKNAIASILKLNPKPGLAFEGNSQNNNYVIPDFFVDNNEGVLEIMLNSKNAPELRISEGFKEMLTTFEKGEKKDKKQNEAVSFIKQKLESAQWFINSIKQRQTTLLHTMNAIVTFQRQFFLSGNETSLKPMILKDIAEMTNLDISTVSRVANSKFVQTQYGTFSLKYFFSEGITMDNGEEVSNKEIKSILAEIVSIEDKRQPLRDEDIMDILAQKGYNISRRTVAKYREQLMIPVARLRKEN
jgi:RNA polymerase sigma-54 factor